MAGFCKEHQNMYAGGYCFMCANQKDARPLSQPKGDLTVLLCCPFCGGEPELDTRRHYKPINGGHTGTQVAIYCTGDDGCPADMAFCREDMPELTTEQLVSDLTERWNKRAT